MSINQLTLGNAVTDIAEGATITYWLGKAASGDTDPQDSQGRIVPSVNVRNNVQYAGVAAGQVSAAHILWPIVLHFLVLPFLIVTFVAVCGASIGAYHLDLAITHHAHAANQAGALTFLVFAPLWVYFILWRVTIKGGFKLLIRRGPKVHFADGYNGPVRPRSY